MKSNSKRGNYEPLKENKPIKFELPKEFKYQLYFGKEQIKAFNEIIEMLEKSKKQG